MGNGLIIVIFLRLNDPEFLSFQKVFLRIISSSASAKLNVAVIVFLNFPSGKRELFLKTNSICPYSVVLLNFNEIEMFMVQNFPQKVSLVGGLQLEFPNQDVYLTEVRIQIGWGYAFMLVSNIQQSLKHKEDFPR